MVEKTFLTSSQYYGEKYIAGDEFPVKQTEVPLYSQAGERDLLRRHNKMAYKHETLKKIQDEFDSKPKPKPTNFPVKAASLEYPTSSSVNPLYATSSQQYGVIKPSEFDVPPLYHPRNSGFTAGFLGGNFQDTGLVSNTTKSRVHNAYDQ